MHDFSPRCVCGDCTAKRLNATLRGLERHARDVEAREERDADLKPSERARNALSVALLRLEHIARKNWGRQIERRAAPATRVAKTIRSIDKLSDRAKVERVETYKALEVAASVKLYEQAVSETAARDKAIGRLSAEIVNLTRVLEQTDPDGAQEIALALRDVLTHPLLAPRAPRHGRPTATSSHVAEKRLRALRLTKAARVELLRLAGLRPKRARSDPR